MDVKIPKIGLSVLVTRTMISLGTIASLSNLASSILSLKKLPFFHLESFPSALPTCCSPPTSTSQCGKSRTGWSGSKKPLKLSGGGRRQASPSTITIAGPFLGCRELILTWIDSIALDSSISAEKYQTVMLSSPELACANLTIVKK